MSQPPKRRALGRGLSALLPQQDDRDSGRPSTQAGAPRERAGAREFARAQIEDIHPSPEQPRRRFADDELDELAQSIRTYGIIQPLVVAPRPQGGYALIAGERRWRAAQRAGLHEVPVVIQDHDERESFERALVENIQRSDLNAIEEAEAYRRLVQDFGFTQDEVAARVGKERSTVANSLRLLRLPAGVREMVETGSLSMGHARALLPLENEQAISVAARQVAAGKLSVRAAEALVRKELKSPDGSDGASSSPPPPVKTPAIRDLETRLERALGARVTVRERGRNQSGVIELRYANLDDLDRILDRLLQDG